MNIFKITVRKADGTLDTESLYFEEQKTAEAVIAAFDFLSGGKNKVQWECEQIEIKSHEQALVELIKLGKDVFDIKNSK